MSNNKRPTNNPSGAEARRVIFMGTPDFALLGLNALAQAADFKIVGIFTQPDKPTGRKQTLYPAAGKNPGQEIRPESFSTGKNQTGHERN